MTLVIKTVFLYKYKNCILPYDRIYCGHRFFSSSVCRFECFATVYCHDLYYDLLQLLLQNEVLGYRPREVCS